MKKNIFKLGFLAIMLVAGIAVQAQSTGADIARQTDAALGDETTPTAATPGADAFTAPTSGATVQGGAIRVIDNKGTKKYLQVQNGLTQLTNTAPLKELFLKTVAKVYFSVFEGLTVLLMLEGIWVLVQLHLLKD